MSHLSGFDSEAVGFDCESQDARPNMSSSSQTTEFSESGAGCQTSVSTSVGCMVDPEDLNTQDTVKEFPPPGLNEFLRRVVPSMMEQLDQNQRGEDSLDNSSDSDEEEVLTAKLLQEIKLNDGSGDHQQAVLGVSWSAAGNSLAVSVGRAQHDGWCQEPGLVRVYTLRRSEDRFVHAMDLTEKSCVSVLKYHPSIAALLAYGTTSGEVVICNLRNGRLDEGTTLATPADCHGCRRVSALQWADASTANAFLAMQISCRGERRGAADQVLFSAGADGTLSAWRVNLSSQVLQRVVSYSVRAGGRAADITCFDLLKSSPLRPLHEKMREDVFVVGSKTGKLYLCKVQPPNPLTETCDPVYDVLEGHATCVLDVAFNAQRPGVFVSLSMDAELRVYDVQQRAPLKVLCLDAAISCMGWVSPACLVVGVAGCEALRVYDVCGGRALPVAALGGRAGVTCVAVDRSGWCRVAAGDVTGAVRVWELPTRRMKFSAHDLDF